VPEYRSSEQSNILAAGYQLTGNPVVEEHAAALAG
jgi:hypothetical protein